VARQILGRIPQLILTLMAVSFLTYMLLSLLPGDPVLAILGTDNIDQATIDAKREELGLNDPLPVRYARWLGNVVQGDFGRSIRTQQPVMEAILERLPVTVEIGALALIGALLVSVPLGAYTAFRANGVADRMTTTVSFALRSVPGFVLALLFIYVFAVWLRLLPATGWTRLTVDPVKNLRGAILPALVLGLAEATAYTRVLRSDMIATLQQDFIIMAKAKGLPNWRILFRHALRPSLFSLMTVVGLNIAALVGGALIVETIFALPGIGRLLVDSIQQRDLIMVQGVVLFIASSYVIVNFLVDTLYTVLDPRIRHGRA